MDIVNRSRGFSAAAVIGAALMLSGLPALADGLGAPISVKYSAADAQTARGADVLYKRIHSAAESVCAPLDHGDAISKQHKNACIQTLVANAVATVNTTALSAEYAQKTGTPAPLITAAR